VLAKIVLAKIVLANAWGVLSLQMMTGRVLCAQDTDR
jgi:hypothetical protein